MKQNRQSIRLMAGESLKDLLKGLKSKIDEFKNSITPTIKNYKNDLNGLVQIVSKIEESSSGSWIGFHANLYYKGYNKPKWNESFNSEWGSINRIPPSWQEKNYDEISSFVDSKTKRKNLLDTIQRFMTEQLEEVKALQSAICTELSLIRGFENFDTEIELLNKIENIKWGISQAKYIAYKTPQRVISRDTFAMSQGIKTPPHIQYQAKVVSLLSIISNIEDFVKLAQRLIRQLEIKENISSAGRTVLDGISKVLTICKKFHVVARQLRIRHNGRPTLEIEDEYDVQDLLHSLLKIYFDDVRPEEWTPSYAGGSSIIDFLLKKEKIVIEVKKTRKKLTDKAIGEQLLIDISKYRKHPDCKTLICFIYDPEERIGNPNGMQNDLNQLSDDDMNIITIIEPA